MRRILGKLAIRRVAIGATVALLASLWMAPAAGAIVPPGGGGSYSYCSTMSAGYTPSTDGRVSAWVWDGRLNWDWCVVRTSTGAHYGWVRLSSPSSLSGNFDKAWAVLTIRVQACYGYTTLVSTSWNPNYALATLSGSRYYWAWQQTPSTTTRATAYRVQISGSGYVFPHNLRGWYFSLGPGPYPPSPASYRTYTSACVNP